jgi:hypothetical protein
MIYKRVVKRITQRCKEEDQKKTYFVINLAPLRLSVKQNNKCETIRTY